MLNTRPITSSKALSFASAATAIILSILVDVSAKSTVRQAPINWILRTERGLPVPQTIAAMYQGCFSLSGYPLPAKDEL